jgi:long-subunit acyl-CoA synthetase (AMP-forming)
MEVSRLFDYMTQMAAERPNQAFLSSKVTEGGEKKWKSYTFKEVADICDQVSQALLDLGIKKDDKKYQ